MISIILWSIGGLIVGCIIGSVLGSILGGLAVLVDDLLKWVIPVLPIELSRLLLAIGTSWLVYALCDSKFWFGLIIGWWILCFIWAENRHDISGD